MKKLKRILLIDDDEATNFLNKVILSRSKAADEVIPFQKAEAALNYLRSCNPSDIPELIFLDINMPLMDGWEFMAVYESLSKEHKKSIIVMLTSSINPDDKARASSFKHIAEFKTKPLAVEEIENIYQKFFQD